MSALRLSVPGKPVELIPLGPARARLSDSTRGISDRFTPLHEAVRVIDGRTTFGRRLDIAPRPRRVTSIEWERCLRVMRSGEPCGRRKGHSVGSCKSAAAVERDNARRRSGDVEA